MKANTEQFNFITGSFERPAQRDNESPSEAWVIGWTDATQTGNNINPYSPTSQDAIDWEDGFQAGKAD